MFKVLGFDLLGCYFGMLNINFVLFEVFFVNLDYLFEKLYWIEFYFFEIFLFWCVEIKVSEVDVVNGWVYYFYFEIKEWYW